MPDLLFVDDDRDWNRIATLFFKKAGWNVASAFSGPDAVSKMTPQTDAVVLDLWMATQTEGEEALVEIRRRHEWDHTCVVILTAHGGVGSAVRTLRQGAYQYIEKEVDLYELERVLRGGIARQKASGLRRQILGTLSVDAIRDQIEGILRQTFNPDHTDFVLFAPDGTLRLGKGAFNLSARRFVQSVARSGQPVLARTRQATAELQPILADASSLVAAPIFGGSSVIGLLWMESRKPDAFDRSWQDVLMELGDLSGIAVHIADRALQDRRDLLTRKTELVRDLGHQILSPVAVIEMQIDTLREKELAAGAVPAEALEGILRRLRIIENKIKSIVSVCENLADISEEVRLQMEPTDLGALVQARVDEDRTECDEKGIRLAFQRPPQPVTANVDRLAIQYCLQCLFRNSVEAIERRRRLARMNDLDAEAAAGDDCIEIRLDGPAAPDRVSIAISDSGIGIPPDAAKRVFDPLYTSKAGGSLNGTGLFSVERIVAQHGGSVQAAGNRSRGAVFTITLPRQVAS